MNGHEVPGRSRFRSDPSVSAGLLRRPAVEPFLLRSRSVHSAAPFVNSVFSVHLSFLARPTAKGIKPFELDRYRNALPCVLEGADCAAERNGCEHDERRPLDRDARTIADADGRVA